MVRSGDGGGKGSGFYLFLPGKTFWHPTFHPGCVHFSSSDSEYKHTLPGRLKKSEGRRRRGGTCGSCGTGWETSGATECVLRCWEGGWDVSVPLSKGFVGREGFRNFGGRKRGCGRGGSSMNDARSVYR